MLEGKGWFSLNEASKNHLFRVNKRLRQGRYMLGYNLFDEYCFIGEIRYVYLNFANACVIKQRRGGGPTPVRGGEK